MALPAGTRIGVYEISSSLGAGGMGEVYRARDTKLDRDVALKILPDVFASDPERLARFEREAKTLASLNHPHIAHLHGLEDSGATRALVMELVEGEDLAERIRRGPIRLEDALAIAKQIADALEAAHEQGIIHRDLKPANIKVRDDGTVKVLDFGLAKALEGSGGASRSGSGGGAPARDVLNSPTITTPAMTMQGMILGTAAYMAPEQAKGKSVDKRADIWAFGCVLYEMVTGRRAFAGDDVSDTLASVLRADVDWSGVPPPTLRLLKKCLEKDPKRRLHDIGDAWDLIGDDHERVPVASRALWLAWGAAAVLLAATVTLAVVHFGELQLARETVRFLLQPPPKNTFDIYLALSPNGRRLAFTARDETGDVHLWVRELDTLQARQLPGTEDAWSPFWSPDSRFLGFGIDRTLKKIDVSGGPPQTLGESPGVVGVGAWNADGVIIFGTRGTGPIQRIPATGGVPTPVTVADPSRGESVHSFPFFLPDGQRFLYFRQSSNPEVQGIYAASLSTTADQQNPTRIVATTHGPVHLSIGPSGERLMFVRDGTLLSQPFDLEKLQVTGEVTPIAEQVGSTGSFGFFTASMTDVLAYRTGRATATVSERLTWLGRKGEPIETVGEARPYAAQGGSLALGPGGTRAVVGIAPTPGPDLWLVEFARGMTTRFTFHNAPDLNPVWSPDGARIVFRSNRQQNPGDLYIKDVNGTSDEVLLHAGPGPDTPTDWSRDGRFLLFFTLAAKTGPDIWALPFEGSKKPVPLLQTQFNEGGARFSPDGRWIAYGSNESGQNEIYLRPFVVSAEAVPSVGAKWQVSSDGGGGPRWRADGKELFYRHPAGGIMAVDVSATESGVRTSLPRQLFALPPTVNNWDVSPDGKRFLVSMPVAPPTSDPISVVLNWQTTLKP